MTAGPHSKFFWRRVTFITAQDFSTTPEYIERRLYLRGGNGGDRAPHEGESCLERLRFLAPFNESHTVPVEHVVATGDAPTVIASEALRLHADLVALGAPAEELEGEDFPSSTVLQVISEVKCPVLCVPSTLQMPFVRVVQEVAGSC